MVNADRIYKKFNKKFKLKDIKEVISNIDT